MYLIRERYERSTPANEPKYCRHISGQYLTTYKYKSIMIGFPLLPLGIVTGAARTNYAWGTYWSWNPKETRSLIVWFIFAAFLRAGSLAAGTGGRVAWFPIIVFAGTIFGYLGVNLHLSGLHSYGG